MGKTKIKPMLLRKGEVVKLLDIPQVVGTGTSITSLRTTFYGRSFCPEFLSQDS